MAEIAIVYLAITLLEDRLVANYLGDKLVDG